jgi:hypothetical protein
VFTDLLPGNGVHNTVVYSPISWSLHSNGCLRNIIIIINGISHFRDLMAQSVHCQIPIVRSISPLDEHCSVYHKLLSARCPRSLMKLMSSKFWAAKSNTQRNLENMGLK